MGEGKHGDSRRKHKGKHCPFGPFADKRFDSKHHSFRKCHRRDGRDEGRASHDMEAQESAPQAPSAPSAPAPAPAPTLAPAGSILVPNPAHVPAPAPAPATPAPSAPAATVTDSPMYPALDNADATPMDEESPRPGDWLMVDNGKYFRVLILEFYWRYLVLETVK